MKAEVIDKLAALIAAAFGLVAALAWNDAIKLIFAQVFGAGESVATLLGYAIIVTIIAVYATIKIGEMSEKAKASPVITKPVMKKPEEKPAPKPEEKPKEN